MILRRSDIERGLDDLISGETGFRFQGLAVILATKRWPDLIASERKKDLGADALAKPMFAAAGEGKVLACSTTAELGKIRKDAAKIRDHFPDITKLVFATPATVSLEKAEQWATEIKREFGYDLVVMEREDFITSLSDPANASLLASHLGITVDLEPSLSELVDKVRAAASELIDAWARRAAGQPLIELRSLRVDEQGRDLAEIVTLGEIRHALARGGRVVLEGPAGRGKTTSFVQLARAHKKEEGIPLLIDLPVWTASHLGVLPFLAGMPAFQARALDAAVLARVNSAVHFSFLLNGWNEIGEAEFSQADLSLRTLGRDFPAAGIIVATRSYHLVPPLPGAQRLRLMSLARQERRWYVSKRLGQAADRLNQILDGDPVLDDLTRTPFFLAEVTSIFESGAAIPSTKMGVIAAVIRLIEHSDGHRNQLQMSPLEGQAGVYLRAIAGAMTVRGGVTLSEAAARRVVDGVSAVLRREGRIDEHPGAGRVLATLCAHHVLEAQEYPTVSFRFQHQQFQEFYAAAVVERELLTLAGKGEDERRQFARTYVNEPAWAEPLRMLADVLRVRSVAAGEEGPSVISAGRALIQMAIAVDPVFAAELARLCGSLIWREVRSVVSERLRALYGSPEEKYRSIAVAAMLASGSEDFKDVLGPVLAGDDERGALGIYRRWDEFQLSSLGEHWREKVQMWKAQSRVQFVSQILHYRNVPEIVAFARSDPSPSVWRATLEGLTWIGAWDDAAQFLASFDAPLREGMLQALDVDLIPPTLRGDALTALEKSFEASGDPTERLRILLKQSELGRVDIVDALKQELVKIQGNIDDHASHTAIRPGLEFVRRSDPQWTSAWVAERVAGGSLWHEPWSKLITAVPVTLKEALLGRLENENFEHRPFGNIVPVLAADADVDTAERAFLRLCELRAKITSSPDQRHDFEWAIERQLQTLLRAFPASVLVAALASRFPSPVNVLELDVITRIFSAVGRTGVDLRSELDPDLRERFRSYLKGSVPLVIGQEDYSGELNANLSSVLAAVGAPEDMREMSLLIKADIERARNGRAAWARGDRSRVGNGGMTSYATWHIRAVVKIAPQDFDAVLIDLLREPEYEQAVVPELVRLVEPPKADQDPFRKIDYGRIWEARAGKIYQPYPERRQRYAMALADQINSLLKERENAQQKRGYEFRLRRLAESLAAIDAGSARLVFDVMSLPDEWNNEPRVSAFEKLLFSGVLLPTDLTLTLIEPSLERCRKYGVQQQDEWLIQRFLCLLPFIEDSTRGIKRISELIPELRLYGHHLRGVVGAAGHCRCDDAVGLLQEIASDKNRLAQLEDVWINAVAALDTPASRNLLMSFVDPELTDLPHCMEFRRDDVLATRISELGRADAAIGQRLLKLCEVDLPPARRLLLAEVIGRRGDLESVMAGLNLIDDAARPAVPHRIWEQIELAFVERRPHVQSENTFTLEPRSSNAVRSRLVEMANNDDRRKRSAFALLAQIEEWRLEYGRPAGEPRNPALDSGQPWPPVPKDP